MELLLVKKAQKGDTDAFVELMELHKMSLYKVAKSYLKSEEDIADVMQDTILSAYEHIGELKKSAYFKTWITRILIRAAQSEQKKIVFYSDLDHVKVPERYTGVSLEEKCDLNSAIEQLSEKYRTVIYLKYFSEFTIKEIAFVMNAPEGSVKAYLSRAREELKQILKEDYIYAN